MIQFIDLLYNHIKPYHTRRNIKKKKWKRNTMYL